MNWHAERRLFLVAIAVLAADQATKILVSRQLEFLGERVLLDGFFKLVHWGNTGAAWSLFHGSNLPLALFSGIALLALFIFRRHFGTETRTGQIAVGLLFGGIIGNLIDRLRVDHVIDFFRFYVRLRESGLEAGFPAFNLADSAICIGVGLLLLLSWREGRAEKKPAVPAGDGAP
jgi:signal peptidase II